MQTRAFGPGGVRVSEVGLGTWQLGGTEWGDVSDEQALGVLRAAHDAGVTLFDTADIYGGGRSERLTGRFLADVGGQNVHIATKLGRRSDGPNGWPQNFKRESVRRHTQESLQRLGVEQIFLQQLHCVPFDVLRQGEIFDHLRELQREGLIRHWGCSVETVEEGLFCLGQPGCGALQVILNIFRQKLTTELLPKAHERGVAVLARVPLASGLLSGSMKGGRQFAATDHRNFNANGEKFNVGETFAGVPLDKGLELVEEIQGILQPGPQASLSELALRWVLDEPAVTSVIPGATKPGQAVSNARASELPPLSAAAHAGLRELYDAKIAGLVRGPY